MNKLTSPVLLISIVLLSAAGCSGGKDSASFTGLVEGRVYAVSSPVTDKLISLEVSEGDEVSSGMILGAIDTASLKLQVEALKAKAGQIGLQLDELKINTAQVEDTRNYYAENYRKNLELLKVQAVSDQTVRDLKLNADKWERELAGLGIKKQTLELQKKEIDLQLEQLELSISKGSLISPASGYVDKLFYETGEFVPTLRPVIQVVSLTDVWCYVYLGENEVASLSPGQDVEARQGEAVFPARVEHINSRAEFTPKEVLTSDNRAALVYAVRVAVKNPEGILKLGMPVEIHW